MEDTDLQSGIYNAEWSVQNLILSTNNSQCLPNIKHSISETKMSSWRSSPWSWIWMGRFEHGDGGRKALMFEKRESDGKHLRF